VTPVTVLTLSASAFALAFNLLQRLFYCLAHRSKQQFAKAKLTQSLSTMHFELQGQRSGTAMLAAGTSMMGGMPAASDGYAAWGRSLSVADSATFAIITEPPKPWAHAAASLSVGASTSDRGSDAWDALADALNDDGDSAVQPAPARRAPQLDAQHPPHYDEAMAAPAGSAGVWSSRMATPMQAPVPTKKAPPPPPMPAQPAGLTPPGRAVDVPSYRHSVARLPQPEPVRQDPLGVLAGKSDPLGAGIKPVAVPSRAPWSMRAWLAASGVAHLEATLAENGFDDRYILAQLTYSDMLACGITNPGDQRALTAAIRILQASSRQ
jgi:hypothetical protein